MRRLPECFWRGGVPRAFHPRDAVKGVRELAVSGVFHRISGRSNKLQRVYGALAGLWNFNSVPRMSHRALGSFIDVPGNSKEFHGISGV